MSIHPLTRRYGTLRKMRVFSKIACTVLAIIVVCLVPTMKAIADSKKNWDLYCITGGDCAMYDPGCITGQTSDTAVTTGVGAPDGTLFPNLDPSAMANAIDSYIGKHQSSSPLKNLGTTIVASAKAANINPFLIIALAQSETSLGTADTQQVSEAHNIFDRAATSSQPNVYIAPVTSSQPSLWYKWSSVKASVDSTAPENQNAAGGGDIAAYLRNQYSDALDKGDLLSFSGAYDSPDQAQSYASSLQPTIDELVSAAKASGGIPTTNPVTPTPNTTSTDPSASCCPSSAGSTDVGVITAGETTGGPTQADIKAVQQVVWSVLIAGGIDEMHTAAVMGNIAHEGVWDPENSSENPSAPNRSTDPTVVGGYGYGLIGWTPGQSLLDEMKVAGITGKPYTAETQSAVILAAIQGKVNPPYTPDVGKAFLNTNNIEDATTAYQGNKNIGGPYLGFERPADESGSLPDRIASAKQFLQEFGGTAPTSPTNGTSGSGATCCPTDGSSSPGATAQGSDPETIIWNYLVGTMNLSANQAAGIMGNIKQESGFSPTALNSSSGAYGIAQWLGGRLTGLEDLASKEGKDKSDITVQLDYMKSELEGSYNSSVLKPIKASNNLADITRIWLEHYEIPCTPGSSACDAEMQIRLPNAKDVLQKYGSGTVDTGSPSGASSCGGSSGPTSGAGPNGWDLNGANAMVYYTQCDPKWKDHPYGTGKSSICVGGCGITSMAMVVATLADKSQTPLTMADKYGAKYHGDGTSFALYPAAAQDFNLNEKDIGLDFSAAAQTVKNGGLVILAVNTGAFTSGGHVMVIRAVTPDGKFLLADPYNPQNKAMGRGDTNNTPYTADYLTGPGAAANMFAFTKK